MLISDPLSEGSNASSTDNAQKGAACSYVTLLSEGSSASSTDNELWRVSHSERELRCSEGSGMLIGDPLSEGSNASSTDNAQKGAAYSYVTL